MAHIEPPKKRKAHTPHLICAPINKQILLALVASLYELWRRRNRPSLFPRACPDGGENFDMCGGRRTYTKCRDTHRDKIKLALAPAATCTIMQSRAGDIAALRARQQFYVLLPAKRLLTQSEAYIILRARRSRQLGNRISGASVL